MARIDEKRKQRLEQAIRDMGNYGVKLRKPEELPDFDQPFDYKRKREGLSLLIKLRNKMTRRVTRIFLNRPIKKQRCRQQKGLLLPKISSKNGKNKGQKAIIRVSGEINISSPFATATAKPCMYQRKPNES